MSRPSLCDICCNIDWKLLRLPTESEIPSIRNCEPPSKYPYLYNFSNRQTKIDLGLLVDVQRRTICELCSYISRYLESRDIYSADGKSTVGGHRVTCHASIGHQTHFSRYPDVDSNEVVVLFRLSVATHLEGHPSHGTHSNAHLLIDNHFQVCDVGAGNVLVNNEFRDPRPDIDMALFGGRVRPEQLNMKWARRWIDICEHEHDDLCKEMVATPDYLKMPYVRFIDVVQKCIVTVYKAKLTGIRYAALSYVWGESSLVTPGGRNIPDFELTSQNVQASHEPHALASAELPQTIQDMLELAVGLAIQYVWIDRLCIIQDDVDDKASQLSAMHAIYNAAHVVVIAAAGRDVHHGLPGVLPGQRKSTQKEIVVMQPCEYDCMRKHEHNRDGLSLMTCLEPRVRGSSYLENAIWSRRGWTMQEWMFARRCLIFTDDQVRFTCANTTFSEDTYCEFPFPRLQAFLKAENHYRLHSSNRAFAELADPELRLWAQFKALVLEYSMRILTLGGDVHDAFAAIAQALAIEAKDEFLWGIPVSQFETGLSWKTCEGQTRRIEISTLPMTDKNRRVPFPSWSWMGWVGQTSIDVGRERTETEKPTIECYAHSPYKKDRIKIDNIKSAVSPSSSWKHRPAPRNWKFHPNRKVSVDDIERHIPELSIRRLRDMPSNHIPFFWTSSAKFRVSRTNAKGGGTRLRDSLLDTVCVRCETMKQHLTGATKLDLDEVQVSQNEIPNMENEEGEAVGSLSRMKSEFWRSGEYDSGVHEFIVVARRSIPELAEFFPATLIVVHIEGVEGICYRVNLGEISENDWNAANVEWRLIALG